MEGGVRAGHAQRRWQRAHDDIWSGGFLAKQSHPLDYKVHQASHARLEEWDSLYRGHFGRLQDLAQRVAEGNLNREDVSDSRKWRVKNRVNRLLTVAVNSP